MHPLPFICKGLLYSRSPSATAAAPTAAAAAAASAYRGQPHTSALPIPMTFIQ